MDNKKEYCENLYNKYKGLKIKTQSGAHEIRLTTGEIPAEHIDPQGIGELQKVKQDLENCLNNCPDCLSNDQLEELLEDNDFSAKAGQILARRKQSTS